MPATLMPELHEAPPLRHTDIVLFGYQSDAIEAVRNEFKKGVRSTLVVMATGLGKTYFSGFVGRGLVANKKRMLFIVHTDELARQAMEKFRRCGLWPELEKADSFARSTFEPDVVVATRQTMQGSRLKSWPRDYFWIIVVDESHHAISSEYINIFNHFSKARRLLITATPNRTDGVPLVGNICETTAYEMWAYDALTAEAPGPYLSRPIIDCLDVDVDLRGLKKRKGDFNDAELDAVITPLVKKISNALRENIGERRTIAFTPGIASAQALASALRDSLGISAHAVWGDDEHRQTKIQNYTDGDFQVLVNCQLATEGVDFPDVSCVSIIRPTKSAVLISQMVGRGLRLHPGKKNCLILDLAWATQDHDVLSPMEILMGGGKIDKETFDRAKQKVDEKEDGPLDLLELVKKADVEVKEQRREIEIKVAKENVKVKRRLTYDPVEKAAALLGLTTRRMSETPRKPATEGQLEILRKNGFDKIDAIDIEYAGEMISRINQLRDQNKPSPKMKRFLLRQGYMSDQIDSMSRQEAGELVGSIVKGFEKKGA